MTSILLEKISVTFGEMASRPNYDNHPQRPEKKWIIVHLKSGGKLNYLIS